MMTYQDIDSTSRKYNSYYIFSFHSLSFLSLEFNSNKETRNTNAKQLKGLSLSNWFDFFLPLFPLHHVVWEKYIILTQFEGEFIYIRPYHDTVVFLCETFVGIE